MIILEMILPEWVGDENGIIENLQLLWLIAGFVYCLNARKSQFYKLCNDTKCLWSAGMIYFFLLFMREISWGRTFLLIQMVLLFNIVKWVYMVNLCIQLLPC